MSQSDLASEMKSDFCHLFSLPSEVPELYPSVWVSMGCVGGTECQEVRKRTEVRALSLY